VAPVVQFRTQVPPDEAAAARDEYVHVLASAPRQVNLTT
jgi:hypothetical protein